MGKNKLRRFAENDTFRCLVQADFDDIFKKDHQLKGHWRKDFFGNDNPIILELGCGKGEYTVGLSRLYKDCNVIGVDIKGARMWRGAKTVNDEQIPNAAFLRTRIEFINSFFAEGEVDEIWITFADPQLKPGRAKKRLTSPLFLERYASFMKPDGVINLKTDSLHLHLYSKAVAEANNLPIELALTDIYNNSEGLSEELLTIKTTYESRFLAQGKPITYLRFSLAGKKEFIAPDFEPDMNLG